MKSKLFTLVVMAALLAACDKKSDDQAAQPSQPSLPAEAKKSPDVRTVAYYKEHRDEMDHVIADCKNRAINPIGESAESQNCRAAKKALGDIVIGQPFKKTGEGQKY